MPRPECPTCDGAGELATNPENAWSGLVQALTFRPCPDCGPTAHDDWQCYVGEHHWHPANVETHQDDPT